MFKYNSKDTNFEHVIAGWGVLFADFEDSFGQWQIPKNRRPLVLAYTFTSFKRQSFYRRHRSIS